LTQYDVSGMSCAACSARVEKAVRAVPGVENCAVSLLTNSMGVEGSAAPEAVIAAVSGAGYGASLKAAGAQAGAAQAPADALADRETPALLRRLLSSLGFLLALMYVSMGHMMWGWPLPAFLEGNHVGLGLAELLLAAAVLVVNRRFFQSGFRALVRRAPNMDSLVALGASASFGWSVVMLFTMTDAQRRGDMGAVQEAMGQLYFESAAMILSLITVGKTLEARSKGKTTDALKSLMRLSPKTATVLREGKEIIVPLEQLRPGEVFVLRPGDSVPVDGQVLSGGGAVDESALTGESVPVDKAPGDSVSAGTVNRSGFLRCTATRVGEDTTLSQIIRMVSDAAATKAPIAKLADRVSGVFVPVVLCLAALTFVIWLLLGREPGWALARGISVLVISCPCALGLATPVAIMVGSGVGARNGVLFKTAASLEAAGRVQIVALDKTGTITEGQPRVTELLLASGVQETELLRAALAIERPSEHPLARAIVAQGEERKLDAEPVTDFQAHAGFGVTAKWQGHELLAGSADYAKEAAPIPPETLARSAALAAQGKTPLFFVRDGALLGLIAVADTLRPEAPEAVAALRAMGLQVVMLTGDNARTAEAIGRQAGVDRILSGLLPEGKEAAVRALAEEGRVCMVGDGINDAPALTRADLGVAIGAGTDVAIDAADVVLMKSSLEELVLAIRLSRATLRNIRQNLFCAFIYNIIGIPIAAGALIPLGLTLDPMFGAAAMSLSSFCVVSNALRLNLFRRRGKTKATPQKAEDKEKEEKVMSTKLSIVGMMCPHCEAHVKAALSAVPGVEVLSVSHVKSCAEITRSPEVTDEAIEKAVSGAGYDLTKIE